MEEIHRIDAAGAFDWQRIHDEHQQTKNFVERGNLVRLHAVVFDQVERSGAIQPDKLAEFRKLRVHVDNPLLVHKATVNGNVLLQLLDAVTQREIAAGRMTLDHQLHVLAPAGNGDDPGAGCG